MIVLHVNIPEVHMELTREFEAYERALLDNDIDALNAMFLIRIPPAN